MGLAEPDSAVGSMVPTSPAQLAGSVTVPTGMAVLGLKVASGSQGDSINADIHRHYWSGEVGCPACSFSSQVTLPAQADLPPLCFGPMQYIEAGGSARSSQGLGTFTKLTLFTSLGSSVGKSTPYHKLNTRVLLPVSVAISLVILEAHRDRSKLK